MAVPGGRGSAALGGVLDHGGVGPGIGGAGRRLAGAGIGWRPEIAGVLDHGGVGPGIGGAGRRLAGAGIGWRPEIAGVVAALPDLGFCEVIAEGLDPVAPPRAVTELRARGVPVVPHGVRLSLGGADPLKADRVAHLSACAAALCAPLVSEHVAFVRGGGREAGHLLPVPRTRDALVALAANVRRMQAELDVPLALEPIAALVDWADEDYTEADFLAALLDRTGALLLLDVANVYANAVNRGRDPEAELDALPLDRIAYVHVAGGGVVPGDPTGLYHDTHTRPVPAPVLRLLRALCERLPAAPPVLLERDGDYPAAAELTAEFGAVAGVVAGHGRAESPAGRARMALEPAAAPAAPAAAARQRELATAQAALVEALVAGGSAPAGFDPVRLDATRRALLRKRAGEAARVWPLLAASLGADWPRVFAEHADGRPPGGALRDGWDLARALRSRGALTGGAAAELAEREAAMRYDGANPPRPRGRLARAVRRTAR